MGPGELYAVARGSGGVSGDRVKDIRADRVALSTDPLAGRE